MKTKTYSVRNHVRSCRVQQLTKTTDSRSAINLMNDILRAVRTEMRRNDAVNVTGKVSSRGPEQIQFIAGNVIIKMDFKDERIAV